MTIIATPADGYAIVLGNDGDDISAAALDENKRLRVHPASYWASTTVAQRAILCVNHGLYCLPTTELVDFIRNEIGGRSAIEIGSGNGVLAEALGIPATDNHQQEHPHIRAHYDRLKQAPVVYGKNVERIDGESAVKKYKPRVIVCAWLTHLWRPERHIFGGNMDAPDELKLLESCWTLIFVGNSSVHEGNLLLKLPHLHFEESWLYSRALRGTNFVGIWQKRKSLGVAITGA